MSPRWVPGATADRLFATPKLTEGGSRCSKGGRISSRLCGFILQPSLCQKASVVATRVRLVTAEIAGHVADPGTSLLALSEENMAAEKLQLSPEERK